MVGVVEQTLASKASHESFHSTYSQQPPSPLFSSASNQLATDLHTAALQAAGLPVYDIESYLNDPQHQPTLNSPSAKSPPPKKQKIQGGSSSSSSTPVQLGAPKTTHHVSALHQVCQERGLVAEYNIDGNQVGGFNGTVTVGDQVISSEQRWPNKKEAKEGLAVLAMPVVRDMEAVKRDKQISSLSSREQEKNWVGMLLEYHNAVDPTHTSPGPSYTEYAIGLHFASTCTLPNNQIFGSANTPFGSKKAARSAAAKEAVQHLISTGDLNPDGSVKAHKKSKTAKASAGIPTVKVESHG
ncbi:MAG: hypothetical protein Q9181_005125, partial [Wetmoreana brouardii]